jgi:hypothetical protein
LSCWFMRAGERRTGHNRTKQEQRVKGQNAGCRSGRGYAKPSRQRELVGNGIAQYAS